MGPLLALAGALGWNYLNHRLGRPTICSTTRPHVPWWAMWAGWGVLTGWFLPHYRKRKP